MSYKSINPKELHENIFEMIDNKWFLITAAKNDGNYNTMTASWGGMGIMWGKPVTWCVIRPQRYTYEFMEETDYYTFSFYPEQYKKALGILGTKSGRDGDKVAESGLTFLDIDGDGKTIAFKEAEIIMVCKKLYYQDVNPDQFIEKDLDKNYPNKDYHRMYFGEIIECLVKE